MRNLYTILYLFLLITHSLATTTIIPTDKSQANLRDAYRVALQKAAHPWSASNQIDANFHRLSHLYAGEIPVYWSLDATQAFGAFIIPDTIHAPGVTTLQGNFPTLTHALSLTFNDSIPGIWILRCKTPDSTRQLLNWEDVYFEQFLVNILNLKPALNFQFLDAAEFIQRLQNPALPALNPPLAKMLLIPAFVSGLVQPGEYIEALVAAHPDLSAALKAFLQNGGTIYTEGNAAYLLEAASLLPSQTVDLYNTIDGPGADMLAEIATRAVVLPIAFQAQLYCSQAPTIRDTLHTVAQFKSAAQPEDVGKPAVVIYEDPALTENGRIILNVGLPAVGSLLIPQNPQWQWLANAVLLGFSERVDVVRSMLVPTDSLHPEPTALPVGIPTSFEVTLHVRNLWDRTAGPTELNEYIKPYFDFEGVVSGPPATFDVNEHRLTFQLNSINPQTTTQIVYRLKTPSAGDPRLAQIDTYLDRESDLKVSRLECRFSDPAFPAKNRNLNRGDLWARLLFEAELVADLDLNWKNVLGHYFQPFKIFTMLENKERTAAVNTQLVQYAALDVPVYTTTSPLIPIERTPPGKFMDLLRLGADLDGDAATDGPDVDFKSASIFPQVARIETVLVNWKNPWTGQYDDFDFDGLTPTDNDSDGLADPGYNGDRLRTLKITWKPGLNTESEGRVPGYQFYDPFCYWETWLDCPDEVAMAIGAALQDTSRFPVTDSIRQLNHFYYPQWERWMEHDSTGHLRVTRLIKRRHQDYEGFSMVDSSYMLRPTDVDYGWIPQPIRSSVYFLSLGGRGPTMTNPLTSQSDFSTVTYETLWGRNKETPLRSAYTYWAPLPNPLQFEYVAKSTEISDPRTGQTLQELPADRAANLTFNISISTEYSRYWINLMTPDRDGDGQGDGVYAYVIEQIPKGLGGYAIDLPRLANGAIDTQAVADPSPTAIWETPFTWHIYWDKLYIPAALDDDNGDGIDDWLDDTGDRFFNPQDSAYLPDHFPPGAGAWLPGADGEFGDDLVEALGVKKLKAFAIFRGRGREGLLKINDGAWLVNEEIFGGPPWVQCSHVQQAWAVGHQIELTGKPDPTFVGLRPQPVLQKYYLTDRGEPHAFDNLFDPWLKTTCTADASATTYLGVKDPAQQLTPDFELPARLVRNQPRQITLFPGLDPAAYPGYPRSGQGLFVSAVVTLENLGKLESNFDRQGNLIGAIANTHWYDVTVRPDLTQLGKSEVFGAYCAYPRPLVPGDDFRTFQTGWRFNPSAGEILLHLGNADGSATIPEILATRRGYFVFLFRIDPALPDGCYQIQFELNGTARVYSDSLGGSPLDLALPDAQFSLSQGFTQSFVIGTAEIRNLQDQLKSYVTLDPTADVRWTLANEPTDSVFRKLTTVPAYQTDSTLTIMPPIIKFPTNGPSPDVDGWLVTRTQVDVPDAGEAIPLNSGLHLTYRDHFGLDSTIILPPMTVAARGADIVISKKIVRVNNQPVQSHVWALQEGQNTLELQIDVLCLGTDLIPAPKVHQIIGPLVDLETSSLPTSGITTFANHQKRLSWILPDLIPGGRRQLSVTLGLAYVETQGTQPILLCDTTRIDFQPYQSLARDPIWYALDLAIDPARGLSLDPEHANPGDPVKISAHLTRCGTAVAPGCLVQFYQTDPTLPENSIGEVRLVNYRGQDTTLALNYTLPTDDHQVLDLYVVLDADSTIGELSEKNNIAHLTAGVGNALFIDQLMNYPNPFQTETEFIFTLGQSAAVTIKVYALDGRLIRTLDCGMCNPGYNSHYWDGLDRDGGVLANGTYIYKIIAKSPNRTIERREYIVKMR
ncbi:hypothetical protein L0128_17050 [candidate division KSB1 bacterium]|nr:hypothetical protein [candidate division KSB1 bacterium]